MGAHIRNLVSSLTNGTAGEYSCDLHSSSVRSVSGPIPVALARDLEALAQLHQRDVACLTGDLLAAAIHEVISSLPESVQAQIRQTKGEHASAEIDAHSEALSWDAGRT